MILSILGISLADARGYERASAAMAQLGVLLRIIGRQSHAASAAEST